uniref:C1q domain-containing protein n=1 Tax=Amphiprion percula TaxID=161767 RepID=A0A3P8TKA7_AMPPE
MKTLAALILAFSCCSCEPQIYKANGEAYQHSSYCDVCSLTSISQNLGAMGQKIAYMEDKISIPQVAFSATLRESGSGNTGPFTTATPLQYKKVFSNAGRKRGKAFSPLWSKECTSVVSLMKNGERLSSVWDTSGNDAHDMGSNAVVISLEVGDNVYVELMANKVVFDDFMHYNTFSGFLLFTM